ncbi:unnamed protein product [Candidula unifasciata]|uniref:La-related protein 7 n=1 Tax=Candidula unifasciata TaxID=100452 RepID=A0A8S3YBE2_9EUPU|nr:unnamed protein product [Candidula unifasciata]
MAEEEKLHMENQAITGEEEVVLEQEQAEPLKLSSKKHKRKTSPSVEDDIATKMARKDPHTKTQDETSETDRSTRQTDSSKSSLSHSVTTLKRSSSDLDKSLESPCKRLKTEADRLRPAEGKKKNPRRRTKHLIQAVIDQMEFYFGDSNLSKDRYLRQVIDSSPDGYVDLAVFGNFNKLQSLHKDGVSLKVLATAISKSKLLELSSNGCQVRRITPIKEIDQEETDSKTVYVEHLPAHATHMWIRSIFSQCGKVVYISLPVYRTTRMIKGFAFVEFETPEEAAKACQLLNNPLPVKPDDKPGKFPKGNKTLNRLQKLAPVKMEQDSNEENISDDQRTDAIHSKAATSNKKKKNTTKKKKPTDLTLNESNLKVTRTDLEPTEEDKKNEHREGKKKKKKKKKKHSQLVDGVVSTDSKLTQDPTQGATADTDVSGREGESTAGGSTRDVQTAAVNESLMESREGDDSYEVDKSADVKGAEEAGSKKKKKKKRKGDKKLKDKNKDMAEDNSLHAKAMDTLEKCDKDVSVNHSDYTDAKLSRKERKRLRQEDIRRKKLEREKSDTDHTTAVATHSEVHDLNAACSSGDLPAGEVEAGTGEVEAGTGEVEAGTGEVEAGTGEVEAGTGEVEAATGEVEAATGEVEAAAMDVETSGRDVKAAAREQDGMLTSSVLDNNKGNRRRRNDGTELTSILKSKKGQERKKVEFDPVTVTTEFIRAREVRKRKKQKKEKLHLRVMAKKEWLTLKADYIAQQKSHMAALKESLRELRMQENQGQPPGNKRVDLEDVFGTKRLKPSQDLKMAHVESLKFTPNVIVQWKCSHEMPRDKIRTMFKELSGDSIAYIDAKEEAKFGYIRFKDEASAEEFAKLSRRSTSFMARILPADQQEEYWKKANEDRVKKLGRKKHEKGADKIARKVFERNKATFFQKPSHVVFNDDDDDDNAKDNKEEDREISNNSQSKPEEPVVSEEGQKPTHTDS